jgi:hypothetical protein
MVRKSQELRPVMTRIPEGLRRRLEREAEQNRRSMNAEIVARLEASFQREDQEEMIRRATQEAVKSSAGAAVELTLSKLHILPQQPPGKWLRSEDLLRSLPRPPSRRTGSRLAQLSDEELSHPSADKEEKSK